MKQPPCWPYYVGLACLFALLKLGYAHATSEGLLVLLAPTNYLVEVSLSSTSVFSASSGFVHPSLHISINKSCSGFNFWVLCWLMLSVAVIHYRLRLWPMLLMIPLVSYGLTLLVNTSRILTAVWLRGVLPSAVQQYSWLHQAEGALLYLFFLVMIYLGFILLHSGFPTRHAQSA